MSVGTVVDIVDGLLSDLAVESPARELVDQQLITVLESPHRYVPVTTNGLLNGLIDRESVALTVARAALKRA